MISIIVILEGKPLIFLYKIRIYKIYLFFRTEAPKNVITVPYDPRSVIICMHTYMYACCSIIHSYMDISNYMN